MRRCLCRLLLVGIACASAATVRAADAPEPRAIIDSAIKALGGAEKLQKYKAARWEDKGTYYGFGDDGAPYTGKYAAVYPDKFRMEIVDVFTVVIDGEKGWTKMGGDVHEMSADEVREGREQFHAGMLSGLTPLIDGKGYTLSPAGEIDVEGKPAVGVNVTHKDHRDVTLYFDKQSRLPVKLETTVKAEELGGKEVKEEDLFRDYKDVDGMKVPMKMVVLRDGKKYVESETVSVEPLESLDDSVFAKP